MYAVGDLVLLPRKRQGLVRYYGRVEFDDGESEWFGVELLGRSMGNTDGVMQGVRYFEAKENCGIFVLPDKILRKLTLADLSYASEILDDINARYKHSRNKSDETQNSEENTFETSEHSTHSTEHTYDEVGILISELDHNDAPFPLRHSSAGTL